MRACGNDRQSGQGVKIMNKSGSILNNNPMLENAAYDCLSALAGVETYDVNLRDHPEAWKAIEAFAAAVQAAERERCCRSEIACRGLSG